jgi:aspartate/tyrosine/aromatic aminotransferase
VVFEALADVEADPILALAAVFAADPAHDKIDLGIGVYRDAAGRSAVLACVKEAERGLLEEQQTKSYLSPAGEPAFNAAMQALLFGAASAAADEPRVRTVQTPGASGALRIAAELVRRGNARATVWIPAPTWANHSPIFRAAGLAVREYRYHDRATQALLYGEMQADLGAVRAGDVVLLHACCHNPTGVDLDAAQWADVAGLLARARALPLVDMAYQGFGSDFDADAHGLRTLHACMPALLAVSSCSKNFGLYRERTGCLCIAAHERRDLERAHGHALQAARTLYSMPPDHGAAVVARILGSPELRATWNAEVTVMRERIRAVRRSFAAELTRASGQDFAALARQNGMFSMLPVTPAEVACLRSEHHVHLLASGRINVAALSDASIARTAHAIGAVLRGRAVVA